MQRTVPIREAESGSSVHQPPTRIDVSELETAALESFVRNNVETAAVSLEHRGSRTYLLVGE